MKPYHGKYLMKLFQWDKTDGEHSVQQSVYLEKDQTYVFSAYVNTACTDAFGPDGGVYLSFLQGTSLKAKSRVINYKTGLSVDGGWERIELAFTPAASGSYQVAANVYNIGAIAVFDNFQLEKILDTGAPDLSSTGSKAGTASAYNLIQSGSFEFPNAANGIGDRSNVNRWWIYNTGEACPVLQSADFPAEPHSGRFSLTFLPNTSRKQRATQTISVNSSSNKTYILSGWGFMPPSNLQDSKELEGDNANDCRFFGLIAKVSYSDGSTPDYHYVSFNGDINMWQYASGIVVPKQRDKTISTITVSACLDHCANRAYMDDISLIQEPVQTYLYDGNGNLTSATNSEGKTSTEMDSRERLTKYTAINGVQYTLSYSGDSRDPATITSDGVKTSYTYDAAGNVTNTKTEAGGQYLSSSAEYDATKNYVTKTTDSSGAVSTSSYDEPTGRLTTSINPNGKANEYYYNYKKGSPDYTSYSDNSGYLYYNYYDDGQIRQLNRKSYYNGSLKRQSYHFSYDAWGNTTEIQVGKATSNRASTLSSASTLATYSYDAGGKMTRMNYPSGQYVTYGYDRLDRLVQEVYYNSDGSVQAEYQYIYNADGQLAKQQAIRNGAVTESYHFEYDSLGRLIRSREENGSSNVQRTEHLYDTKNRLTTQSWTMGSKSFYENYYYRPSDGALNRITTATGDTVSFGYDALKRVTTVTTKNYTNKVLLTQSNTYQDLVSNQTTGRLSTYTVKGANNQTLVGNRYSYDANGNITKVEEANGSAYRVAAEYTYDALNQLTKETRYTYSGTSTTATDTTVVDYAIDTAGNLRSVTTTVNGTQTNQIIYTYGNAAWADKLTAVTVNGTKKTISYADTLNPKSWYNGTSYTNLTWTQGRRLSSLKKGNQTYSYEYDMSGVRSAKVVNGERHEYVTQNGRVVRDYVTYAGTDTFVRCNDFIYDEAGRPFAMRCYYDSTLTGADTFHYVLNAQGDVVQIIYQGETVYAEYSYDAWGNITSIKGSSSGNMYYANLNPLRYRGYYYDTETGFYYLQSRYYDPAVSRFLNADSYGSTGQGFLGYNMFAYCGNNPVLRSDPSGHSWFSWIAKVREMVEKAKDDAARLKNEFRQRFEATYGVSFESKCDYDYMYVTKKTIEKTETECHVENGLLTAATFAFAYIPGVKWFLALAATAGTFGFTEFSNKPYSYEQYIVDVGTTYNWQRNPDTGEWSGLARGEHLVFNINSDGTLDYKGHIDFASHACTYPIEQPCYFYCTTAARVGVYMYDFDWGNIPPINPLGYENP